MSVGLCRLPSWLQVGLRFGLAALMSPKKSGYRHQDDVPFGHSAESLHTPIECRQAGSVTPSDREQMSIGDEPMGDYALADDVLLVAHDQLDIVWKKDVAPDRPHPREQGSCFCRSHSVRDGRPVRRHSHEAAFGDRSGGPPSPAVLVEPTLSGTVMDMIGPRQADQKIDVQQVSVHRARP